MEVPRLLVDAGLVAFSTAAIFFLRKFFIKSRELEANIKELNETVKTLRSDEESYSTERKALDTRLENATGYLEIQRELLIEIGKEPGRLWGRFANVNRQKCKNPTRH